MAYLDRADLIRRLKVRVGRPSSDNAFTVTTTDDVYDDKLTEAQDHIQKQLGIHVPDAIWPVPTQLTSADGGLTYGFGSDTDGAAIFAFGHFQLFESLEMIPDYPLEEGADFEVQGALIRMPNNVPRTFSAGPYARFASPANAIGVGSEPVIPKLARLALLSEAEVGCWKHLGMDSSGAEAEAERDWNTVLEAIKTQSMFKTAQPRRRTSTFASLRRYGLR